MFSQYPSIIKAQFIAQEKGRSYQKVIVMKEILLCDVSLGRKMKKIYLLIWQEAIR